MKIACLCPTYKRPLQLANVAECFLRQDYPESQRRLFILDDASQHVFNFEFPSIRVKHAENRIPNLPLKFNLIAEWAGFEWQPDVMVVWEDDDVFLPWHLSSIAKAVEEGGEYLVSEEVWSTYNEPEGSIHLEGAAGRFHSSWAFTSELFHRVGGYPETSRLDFDQQMRNRLSQGAKSGLSFYSGPSGSLPPSYVYRWGNGVYHGSQAGEEGFADLWSHLETLPDPFQGPIQPRFDNETEIIYGSEICVGHTA